MRVNRRHNGKRSSVKCGRREPRPHGYRLQRSKRTKARLTDGVWKSTVPGANVVTNEVVARPVARSASNHCIETDVGTVRSSAPNTQQFSGTPVPVTFARSAFANARVRDRTTNLYSAYRLEVGAIRDDQLDNFGTRQVKRRPLFGRIS